MWCALERARSEWDVGCGHELLAQLFIFTSSLPACLCRWDEDVFGLEYDLDLFNIVAVDDFNMGGWP